MLENGSVYIRIHTECAPVQNLFAENAEQQRNGTRLARKLLNDNNSNNND